MLQTLRELRNQLNLVPEDKLDENYSVKVEDEFFSGVGLIFNDPDADGILDENSAVLISLGSKAICNEYEEGECPECGEAIPLNAAEGQKCEFCPYIFAYFEEVDNELFDPNGPNPYRQ